MYVYEEKIPPLPLRHFGDAGNISVSSHVLPNMENFNFVFPAIFLKFPHILRL